jgi:regulator of chromosome condensation
MAEDGELSRDGKPGGGLETIYAGGMHNLAIDEAGKVSTSPCLVD